MRFVVLIFGVIILAGVINFWSDSPAHSESATKSASKSARQSFAVVELFTSEGCSSCPPADRLLGEMVDAAAKDQQRIFALAFHVDYWDYIGWKDPFANRAHSDRLREYARAFRSRQIYTPQMIVNGQREFVGSNRAKAQASIEWALSQPAGVSVALKLESDPSNKVRLSYEVTPTPEGVVLHIALVERDLRNDIQRGENAGRVLHHDNVVRAYKTVSLKDAVKGEITIEIPGAVDWSKSSIIGYVQDVKTMNILGASDLEVQMDSPHATSAGVSRTVSPRSRRSTIFSNRQCDERFPRWCGRWGWVAPRLARRRC